MSPLDDTEGIRVHVADGWVLDVIARERLVRSLARAPRDVCAVAATPSPLPAGASYRTVAERAVLRPHGELEATQDDPPVVARRPGSGTVLRDPGAHAHDTSRPTGTPADAGPEGRSPFPWRPVVVFLDTTGDGARAEWAAALTDAMLAYDVEGRLASSAAPEGMRLTRPCLPSAASLRALRPDVVVALDDDAVERAHEWCASDRNMVVVAYDATLATVELVSWRIGRASGRLRARLGPAASPPAVAQLVRRLTAGPHPIAPGDEGDARRARPDRRTPHRPVRVRLHGDPDRLSGLADHVRAAGHAATVVARGERPGPAPDSVVDVVDVVEGTDAEVARARACGLATTTDEALRRALLAAGVRAVVAPTLVTRERADAIRQVRGARPVVPLVAAYGTDVSLDGVSIERVTSPPPDVATYPTWSVLLVDGHRTGTLVAIEAALAGVPVVDTRMPRWEDDVRVLLVDPDARAHRSRAAIAHADACVGSAGAAAVANRFVGWVRRSAR